MKSKLKIKALAIFILSSVIANAQNVKVQTAWNYYKYDKLDDAVAAIEDAVKHEQTMGKEKTWYYRGLIYHKIAENINSRTKYPDCIQLAYESFSKSLEINPRSEYAEDIALRKIDLMNRLFQSGVEQFNSKNYQQALAAFEAILAANPKDSLALLNAALSSERSGNKLKAIKYYERLVEINYSDPKVYIFLSNLYKSNADTTKGFELVKSGRTKFPADQPLIIEELNYYLAAGKSQEAIESLNQAIARDQGNANLYFARGYNYDKLGDVEKAKNDYKKSIEIKPDYFDPNYNLGALYFNQGADLANKANNIPPSKQREYDEAKKKADEKFKEAKPYLEKSLELSPDDKSTLLSLKQLYARLGETAKYEMVKSKLDQLK